MYNVCLDKECTFKPYLVTRDSKLSKSVLQDCLSHDLRNAPESAVASGNTTVVFERLSKIAKDKIEHRNLHINHSRGNVSNVVGCENLDPKTGQPYFQP